MTKKEFVNAVAAQMGVSKRQAESACNDVFDTIKSAVMLDGEFSWPGFGSFKCVEQAERTARNPRTGESVKVSAKNVVKFKPAKALTDQMQ